MTAKTPYPQDEKLTRLEKAVQDYKEQLAGLEHQNQELARQIKEQALFLNFCPVGLVLIQQGRVLDLNRSALAMLGYEAEELIGRAFWNMVDPASKNTLKERARNRRKGKWVPSQFETTLVRKDGTRLECEIRLQSLKYHGRGAMVAGLIELGTRNQHLKELIHSLKTEALLTMAIGLKKQLTPNFSSLKEKCLLLKKGNLEDPDSLVILLTQMEAELAQIQTTLNTLDALAKTGYDLDELSVFHLKTLLQTLTERITPLLQMAESKSPAKINFKTYLRADSRIRGHFQELQQALLYLLVNALEAMPQGGDLYLSTEESAGQALIYIQDSGSGIPDEFQTRVQDPFFSTKGKERPGLGSSLAAAIIKRHHGSIEYGDSGKPGTIITIKLPLPIPENDPKTRPRKQKIKNASVLIIEHQDLVRPLLSQILQAKGLKVTMLSTGFEAITRLKAKPFDLVLVGTWVPDKDKQNLAQEIKKIRPRTALVLVLDQPGPAASGPLKETPADLVLTQPLDLNKAVAQMLELLRRNS
jgi:two-component system sporulation sensor kinase C